MGRHHPVGHRVVDLGDERHPAALEPLDRPDLPERSAPIERAAGHLRDHLVELVTTAGRRGGAHVDVVVEVEPRILDPPRVVELQGRGDDAPPQGRQQVEALLQLLLEPLEGVPPDRRGGIQNGDLEGVHVLAGCFVVEKRGVLTSQPFHGASRAPTGHSRADSNAARRRRPPARILESDAPSGPALSFRQWDGGKALRWPGART